jgi:hypothetical protein
VRPAANYCRPKVRSTAGVSSRFGKMTDSARQKAATVNMVCEGMADSSRHILVTGTAQAGRKVSIIQTKVIRISLAAPGEDAASSLRL